VVLPSIAVVLAALLVAGVVALHGTSPPGGPATGGHPDHDAAATTTDVRLDPRAQTGPSSAGELSLRLEAALGQHSVLAADLMRSRLRGDPDLAQAANAALGRNTDALGQIVGSLFGDAAERQFGPMWTQHVAALFNYARGLAEKNDTVVTRAREDCVTFEGKLAAFFAGASNGRLGKAAAEAAITMHITHLLQQADAYAAKDYARADQLYRQAYAHTYGLGRTLAATLLPPDQAAALATPAWRLRSQLGQLLGEHVALVTAATRVGVADTGDFPTAAQSVNGNTRDLAAAVDSLFGRAAAARFQALWADHVDALMSYTSAAMTHDSSRATAANAELAAFERELAAFLGAATGQRLPSAALAKAFGAHDEMLTEAVDALALKNYARADDLAYTTYQQMFDLAGRLATAFGATITAGSPKGGPQTGRGPGTAPALPVPGAR
jgi:hypothetical protein